MWCGCRGGLGVEEEQKQKEEYHAPRPLAMVGR